MTRKSGFYWVKDKDVDVWLVAMWSELFGGQWSVPGVDGEYGDSQFSEIDDETGPLEHSHKEST